MMTEVSARADIKMQHYCRKKINSTMQSNFTSTAFCHTHIQLCMHQWTGHCSELPTPWEVKLKSTAISS